jgi:type I restriction enzyme, S subunit
MKKGWERKRLGDLAEIELGKTPARANASLWDEKRETGNVWLSIADLLNAEGNVVVDSKAYVSDKGAELCKLVPKGTLLVSFKLTLGRLAFAGRDLFTNEAIAALTLFNERELSKEFLFWFLQFFDWVKAAENDVKLKGMTLNKAKLKEMVVHFPKLLAEQRRIVGILDEAFAGLATAQAHAEKNLQNARALFESHLNNVFSKKGEGWVETTLDKISTNLDSRRVPITKNVRSSGEYPYYGASGIVDYVAEYIFEGDNLLVSEDGANLLARATPIAFSVSGKYWVNNHAHILHFDNMATQRFAEFYLESIPLDEYITGAAQPKLNQKALNSIPIPIPKSVDEQAEVVKSIEGVQAETRRLAAIYERKLSALGALKKSLLHRAFAGEL